MRPEPGRHRVVGLAVAGLVAASVVLGQAPGCGDEPVCDELRDKPCGDVGLPDDDDRVWCDECGTQWVCRTSYGELVLRESGFPCECVDDDGYLLYYDEWEDPGGFDTAIYPPDCRLEE